MVVSISQKSSMFSMKNLELHISIRSLTHHSRMESLKEKTVMEMARCMLYEKKLPKFLWVEVVNTSAYLLNRLPTKSLQGKTPIEAWFSDKPSIKHLVIFGSLCYLHVPSFKRENLGEKAEKGIHISYATETKGYRIYSLGKKKIVISRDVHFDDMRTGTDLNKVHDCDQTTQFVSKVSLSLDVKGTSDTPVLKVKSLYDVYERCNLVHAEPASYKEVAKKSLWIKAMKDEIDAI